MRRVTLRKVNDALAAAGHPERLVRGNGYFYFIDGAAFEWYSSSVYVSHLNAFTVEQWIARRNELAKDPGGTGHGITGRRFPQ